ncbi:MAG: metallophosphatase [Cylindrospermopsis raciborskii KL1]|uniref:metallophosphoesterase family protein n=1 Tax=Cylindrospermopsis raciborskii TaxID=77022 RepID=UPI001A18DA84|nr:metallophosphatase [Cylindrospermopsis raciborskii]MBG0744694.1 metallophosphatase [Cylindrospermopsis raciborskii KL1]
MTCSAILSGIEGNLAAYEAVLADIKRQRHPVEELYILGDVIAATPASTRVIQRIRSPRTNEPAPQVCRGWWEEQLLILHGLGRTGEPTELIERYGMEMVKTLWDAIPREMVEWVRSLDFGFFELDCLLIHGSSVSVSDELTPETPPIQMLDRLLRMDANTLFCGRSGLTFQYQIQQGTVTSSVTTLDQRVSPQATQVKHRQIVGVGNVGRIPGQATYTLYHPNSNRIEFKTVRYSYGRGFQTVEGRISQ